MNKSTIQRGSVLALSWTGDHPTPFESALPVDEDVEVERLDPDEVEGLHSIPVTPLAYKSAREILERMSGHRCPPTAGRAGSPSPTGSPGATT